jgi:hypothetical protein
VGGTCRTCGKKRKTFSVLLGNMKGRALEDLMSMENNNQVNPEKIGWDGVDWISIAEDRDKWRTVLNTVMNLGVCKMWGIS